MTRRDDSMNIILDIIKAAVAVTIGFIIIKALLSAA